MDWGSLSLDVPQNAFVEVVPLYGCFPWFDSRRSDKVEIKFQPVNSEEFLAYGVAP